MLCRYTLGRLFEDVVIEEHPANTQGHSAHHHALSFHSEVHQKYGGGHVSSALEGVGAIADSSQHSSYTQRYKWSILGFPLQLVNLR